MDFNELIADFAERHSVEDLTVTDNAAAEFAESGEKPSLGSDGFMQV